MRSSLTSAASAAQNPTTTDATTITVSGTADAIVGESIKGAANISVQLFNGSTAGQIVVSDGSGNFAFDPVATNGSALDLTVEATGSGERTDFVIPAAPLVADQPGVPVLAIPPATFSELAMLAGTPQGSGQGAFGLQVSDCAGTPIAGATFSIQQGGSNVGGTPFDVSALSSAAAGLYFVFSIPPGTTTVIATVEGHAFRTRTLTSVADATTTTQIKP